MSILFQILEERRGVTPGYPAFKTVNNLVTWGQFYLLVERLSKEMEWLSGGRIVFYMPQSITSIAVLVVSDFLRIDAVLVPSYYDSHRLETFFKQSHADAIISCNQDGIDILRKPDTYFYRKSHSPSMVSILTSGTTGAPKIIKHNWATLSASIGKKSKFSKEVWFLGYPVTHYAGLQVFLQAFLNGASLVVPEDIKPGVGAPLINQCGVTYLNVTPTYFRQMVLSKKTADVGASSVKHITFGGEIADQSVIDLAVDRFPTAKITHIYASTELGVLLRVNDGMEGFDISHVDESSNLKVVNGELFTKKTKGSMVNLGNDKSDGDEWISTGDMVEVFNNRVLFKGRKKEVINIGGFKVSPHYVESVVNRVEGVQFSMVSAKENALVGNLIKLTVVVESSHDENIVKSRIVSHCKKTLPYFMVPRLFDFVDSIPVTYTCKVKRG